MNRKNVESVAIVHLHQLYKYYKIVVKFLGSCTGPIHCFHAQETLAMVSSYGVERTEEFSSYQWISLTGFPLDTALCETNKLNLALFHLKPDSRSLFFLIYNLIYISVTYNILFDKQHINFRCIT